MELFTCMYIDEQPRILINELFEITDTNKRQWLCRKELSNEKLDELLGGSEYAYCAYYFNQSSEFAESMGSSLGSSMFDMRSEDFFYWNSRLLLVNVDSCEHLAEALSVKAP